MFRRFYNYLKASSLQAKISLSYSLIFMGILAVLLTLIFRIGYAYLQESVDNNLCNVAAIVSQNRDVVEALKKDTPSQAVNQYCDNVLAQTKNIDVITICNPQGIRIYHLNKANIGKHIVGGDEIQMEETHQSYFSSAQGTFGYQRRFFYPLHDENGKYIGFLLTSVLNKNLDTIKYNLLYSFIIIGLATVIIIFLVAGKLHILLRHSLMGYEPEQIAIILTQRQEVLNALDEGILAINANGQVIVVNSAAVQMLNITDKNPEGKQVLDVFPESLLPRTLKTLIAEYNVNLKLNKINLITSRIPIIENGKLIGAVSIFSNYTTVTKLSEKLTGVNHMVDAMRAYTHEFTNKLHVILGLSQSASREEIADYIMNVTTLQKDKISFIIKAFKIPTISALLIGKTYRANELNISLNIDENSQIADGEIFLPAESLTTIIGNILENAIENLNATNPPIKEINLSLFGDAAGFFLTVSDTGSGIPESTLNKIFTKGFSTKGENRGTGLYLVKDLVDAYDGDIQVTSEEGNGTIFTVAIKNSAYKGSNAHV